MSECRVDMLLRACLQDKLILGDTCSKFPSIQFAHLTSDRVRQVAYGILYRYYEEHKRNPSTEEFQLLLSEEVESWDSLNILDKDKLEDNLIKLFLVMSSTLPEDFNPRFIANWLVEQYRATIGRSQMEDAYHQAVESGDYDELTSKVSDIKAKTTVGRKAHNPFLKKRRDGHRTSTGVGWFDKLTNGGYRKGNAYGLIASTGTGKTTFACQLAVAAASVGKNVQLYLTEQSADEPEIKDRFISLISERTLEDLDQYDNLDDMPLSEAELQTIDRLSRNLVIYDFSTEIGTLEELQNYADGRGEAPKADLVILDWIGRLGDSLIGTDRKFPDKTRSYQYIADELNRIARQLDISVVMFHQMAGSEGTSHSKSYNHTMAQECKTLFNNVAYGGVISPVEKTTDITTIGFTKSRFGPAMSQIVKREGAYSHFRALEGYKLVDGQYRKDFGPTQPVAKAPEPEAEIIWGD